MRHSFFPFEEADQIDQLACAEPCPTNVVSIQKDDTPSAIDPAVSVIHPVDRRVELIVAPDGRHEKLSRSQVVLWNRRRDKVRLARVGLKVARPCAVGQIEDILPDALVEILEARNGTGDVITTLYGLLISMRQRTVFNVSNVFHVPLWFSKIPSPM